MGATKHLASHLGSMPDDLASAVFTFRRHLASPIDLRNSDVAELPARAGSNKK